MKTFWKAGAVLLALVLLPEAAYACEKCFGAGGDADTIRAITLSMAALLIMVGLVGGGIGMFFINVRKRAKMLEPGDLMVNQYGDLRSAPSDDPDR